MSAFSFTAPYITPEQEQEEFSSFPDEVKEDIRNDLYGTSTDSDLVAKTQGSFTESLSLLDEALQQISAKDKQEYLDALNRVPDLVKQESPGLVFLQATRFDPWAAAKRLTSYWKLRKSLFGERAFLPMTLDGAMHEDRRVFELGFFTLLPPDRAGRQIIFWNRIACTRNVAHRDVFVRGTHAMLLLLSTLIE